MYVYDLPPYKISHATSNYSLVTTIKPKAKYRLHTATMLSVYFLQKVYLNKSCKIFEDLLPCHFRTLIL